MRPVDGQMKVWFKAFWDNKIKQDLREGKADMLAIQNFVSHFVIGDADGATALSNAQSHKPAPPGTMTKLLGYLSEAHDVDPTELTTTLRASPPLLQHDESVDAAFRCGRDLFVVSTKRIIVIDKKV